MASDLQEFKEQTARQLSRGLEQAQKASRKELLGFAEDFELPKVGKTEDLRTVVIGVYKQALALTPEDAWEFYRKQKPVRQGFGLSVRFAHEGIPREYQEAMAGDPLIEKSWKQLEDFQRDRLVRWYTEEGGRQDFREFRINKANDEIMRPFFAVKINGGVGFRPSNEAVALAAERLRDQGGQPLKKAVWEYTAKEWENLSPEQRLAAPHASTGAPISATNYHLLNVRARLQRGESVPEKVIESYGPFNPLRADARSELERARRMTQSKPLKVEDLALSDIRNVTRYIRAINDSRRAAARRNRVEAAQKQQEAQAILGRIPGGLQTVNRVDDALESRRQLRVRPEKREAFKRAEKAIAELQRPQPVSLSQAQERFDSLSDRRKALDGARTAQNIAPAEADTDKERRLQQRWLKNPSRLDFQGVDTKKAGDLTDLRKAVVAADFAQSEAFRKAREAQLAGAPESEVAKLQADAQKKFSELKSLDAKLAQVELKSGLVRTGKGGTGFTRMGMRRTKKL